MHFEILVEDASGKIALESVLEKILGPKRQDHSYRVISYKGIGRIPKDLRGTTDPQKRIFLDRLPKLLRGYGKSLQDFPAAVVVVVDLDDKDCLVFKQEMLDILNACNPQPTTLVRLEIEDGEAWLLGDRNAVKAAYLVQKSRFCTLMCKTAFAIHGKSSQMPSIRGDRKNLNNLHGPIQDRLNANGRIISLPT